MKSFTHSQFNNPAFRADKRLEALMKKEMMEHQHIISSHNKEMQELRNWITISMQRFDSILEKWDSEIKCTSSGLNEQILLLKETMLRQEETLKEQKETINSLYGQLSELNEIYASKLEVDKHKKELEKKININTEANINSFQGCQMEFKTLFNDLKEDLLELKNEVGKLASELMEKIEKSAAVLKIDKDGVLKEVRVYEKTIFIIEKKIENLYTLIERINQSIKGQTCHKLD